MPKQTGDIPEASCTASGISPHKAEIDVLRPEPPDLEFRCPDCSICDKETDSDGDGFVCYGCEVSWGTNGAEGKWDQAEPGCRSVIEYHNTPNLGPGHEIIRHVQDRCYLPKDHTGTHRAIDLFSGWTDDDPRVVNLPE